MIGADLRRPALGDRFDSATGPGLGELLGGLYPFDECVQEVAGHEGLFMLHAGVLVTGTSPVDIFRTDDFGHLIEEVRPQFDHILIDCPPVLPVVDALEITRVCDGIVLSVFAGTSRFGRVERAVAMIMQATRKPILGFVMTGAKAGNDSYNNGYYYGGNAWIEEIEGRAKKRHASTLRLAAGSTRTAPAPTSVGRTSMPLPVVEASLEHASIENDVLETVDLQIIDEDEERDAAAGAVSSQVKERKMRALRYLFAVGVALASLATTAAPAGAQYEGDSPETGVLEVSENPGPDSPLEYTHSGLKPFSDLTFQLETAGGEIVPGVEVAGVVVVQADANGNFNGDVSLPALDDGVYTLRVSGTLADDRPFTQSYAISIDNGAARDVSTGALALTGASSTRTAFNGVLIIAVGAGLVAFAARSQRKTEEALVD